MRNRSLRGKLAPDRLDSQGGPPRLVKPHHLKYAESSSLMFAKVYVPFNDP